VKWQLVESDAALRQLLVDEAGSDTVAVDTEFMRRNTFYPQVALVQLCFGERAWLIDPLALQDPAPLADLLTDPVLTKVIHSASEDLEVFQRWLGVLPAPLFDTQRAAALLDRGFGTGYRALVLDLLGVDLPKGETRSDWLRRPLTESQCEYAAQDVAWLLPVWKILSGECEAAGKLDWVLADGSAAVEGLAGSAGDYHRRIKNAWKLDRRQLGTLIAVCEWREMTARQRDKPRNWIIDDRACLQLAQCSARNRAELGAQVELPPPVLRRHGDELLALLEARRRVPESELPERLPPPLQPAQRQQLKRLRTHAREIAKRLEIAPEALLQSRDYEILLRESEGEAVQEPLHWRGWRAQTVIEPLRELLGGEAA
jgi:ribonuclease D